MASNPILLNFDRQADSLTVANGSQAAFPPLYQGDVRDLQFAVFDPSATGQYTQVNLAGSNMYVTLGATPRGDGTQTIYAGPLVMTWQPNLAGGCFTGSLDLTQAALATAMGAGANLPATISVQIKTGTVFQTIFQAAITINAPENPAGAVITPAGPNLYLTQAESDARYVRKDGGNNGDGFFMKSLGGLKRFFQLSDPDGTFGPQ